MLPRGPGRPIGSRGRREAQFKNYNPRRWHPEFDLIVIESVAGKSNEEIGREFGYTKEHISNILSTAQAEVVRAKIRETINKEFDGKLKDRLAKIGERCVAKIETFIEDERGLSDSSPFMFVDRALKIAQAVRTLDSSDNGNRGNTTIVQGNAFVVNNDQGNQLKDALTKSMSLDSINIGDTVESKDPEVKQLRVS